MTKQLKLIDLGKYDLNVLIHSAKVRTAIGMLIKQQELIDNTKELKQLTKIVKL